jgi:hypothetical protein
MGATMLEKQPEGPVLDAGDGVTPAPGDTADRPGDPIARDGDGLTAALDDLAESAERTSAEQKVIADSARAMSAERRRGRSWAAILAGEGQPSVLDLLGSSLRRLSQTSSRFRTAVAASLLKEGLSTRQVAAHLSVTHQRVSAMLNRPKS